MFNLESRLVYSIPTIQSYEPSYSIGSIDYEDDQEYLNSLRTGLMGHLDLVRWELTRFTTEVQTAVEYRGGWRLKNAAPVGRVARLLILKRGRTVVHRPLEAGDLAFPPGEYFDESRMTRSAPGHAMPFCAS